MRLTIVLLIVLSVAIASCYTTSTTVSKDGHKKGNKNIFLSLILNCFPQMVDDYDQDDLVRSPRMLGLSPVILVPGNGGSRLVAKLNYTQEVSNCKLKPNSWFDLWFNLSLLLPTNIDCFVKNIRLFYDKLTRRTYTPPGVTTKVDGFSLAAGVSHVHSNKLVGTKYFDTLIKKLIRNGYQADKNIFGAPYDWRRSPNELEDFFDDLRNLILRAYKQNNNQRVVLICHSMGCLNSLHFLHSRTQAWKDRYIQTLIAMSGPWGGSVKSMKILASGDSFGLPLVSGMKLREDMRSFTSIAYLMPRKGVFDENEELLSYGNKSYTVNDYQQFYQDIGYPLGHEMWLDVHNITDIQRPPGVEVYCLYGDKVDTLSGLTYDTKNFPDARPTSMSFGSGDGTVNLKSLNACKQWSKKQVQPVHVRSFDNTDHMEILNFKDALRYVLWILGAQHKYIRPG